MRRAVALGLVVTAAAAAPAAAKIDWRNGTTLDQGRTPGGQQFRVKAMEIDYAFRADPFCVALLRGPEPRGFDHTPRGEQTCDNPDDGPWTVQAAWGGECRSGAAGVVGLARAATVRVRWFGGKSAMAETVALPPAFAADDRDYSVFYVNAVLRKAVRAVEALGSDGAVLARLRVGRRERRMCPRGYAGHYSGSPLSG